MLPLLIGTLMIVGNMAIQVMAVVVLIRYSAGKLSHQQGHGEVGADMLTLSIALLVLLAGHIVQFATWAVLFRALGEFSEFSTAFYHSTVNFASLGYGDIVMSEKWRLLGALEAANGVLMFGLTAGAILTVMNRISSQRLASRGSQS
jgi:hypothetical protein